MHQQNTLNGASHANLFKLIAHSLESGRNWRILFEQGLLCAECIVCEWISESNDGGISIWKIDISSDILTSSRFCWVSAIDLLELSQSTGRALPEFSAILPFCGWINTVSMTTVIRCNLISHQNQIFTLFHSPLSHFFSSWDFYLDFFTKLRDISHLLDFTALNCQLNFCVNVSNSRLVSYLRVKLKFATIFRNFLFCFRKTSNAEINLCM